MHRVINMKKIANIVKSGAFLGIVLALFIATPITTNAAESVKPAVYDLILFWGQSNMVGSAIGAANPFDGIDIKSASEQTGIDQDLIQNTESASKVDNIEMPDGAAYEYKLTTDSFTPITGTTKIGESGVNSTGVYTGVVYNKKKKKFQLSYMHNGKVTDNQAASSACEINMVNEFCSRWYEQTGHGVIVVFAAVGGAPIQKFVPVSDPMYVGGPYGSYVYEYLATALDKAMKKTKAENILLSHAYFVSFQGEGNNFDTNYKAEYQKVVSYLKTMSITQGALVETSFTIGEKDKAEGIKTLHQAQMEIIAEDPSICLGSALDFDHYIPDRETYESPDAYWRNMWKNLPYDEAYRRARLLTDTEEYNRIHLNSTALSMIGRQTADNLAVQVGAMQKNDINVSGRQRL